MVAGDPDRVTVVVVLGMHKSGTSLISEILHRSGIEMIEQDSSLGYDEGFHHERRATSEINKDLLRCRDLHSLETIRKIDASLAPYDLRRTASQFVQTMTARQVDWGFKDPRTCLTYDLWREVLPPHKLICVFRDANEVLKHYTRVKKGSPFRVLRAWFRYNTAMLDAFQKTAASDRVMIHYRSFMERDDGLAKLSAFLGRPLSDQRSDRLMRSKDRPSQSAWMRAKLHKFLSSQDVLGLNRRLRSIAEVGLPA